MDRNHRAPLIAALALSIPLPAITADGPRFDASGEVVPLARSLDGRFAAIVEVRVSPGATSSDGRFALKATHSPTGGCSPFPDPIFSNGFEP